MFTIKLMDPIGTVKAERTADSAKGAIREYVNMLRNTVMNGDLFIVNADVRSMLDEADHAERMIPTMAEILIIDGARSLFFADTEGDYYGIQIVAHGDAWSDGNGRIGTYAELTMPTTKGRAGTLDD